VSDGAGDIGDEFRLAAQPSMRDGVDIGISHHLQAFLGIGL